MTPTHIELHKQSRRLELAYDDGIKVTLSAEFLRVHSPSAEVRGHHPSQAVLQHGKIHVGIHTINAVGNYALQINFDDGHNSGIYSWEYLRELGEKQAEYWQQYEAALIKAGKTRDPEVEVVSLFDPKK